MLCFLALGNFFLLGIFELLLLYSFSTFFGFSALYFRRGDMREFLEKNQNNMRDLHWYARNIGDSIRGLEDCHVSYD